MARSVRTMRHDHQVVRRGRPMYEPYEAQPDPPVRLARWVPPGERIVVGEHLLPDGMIYVGHQSEPATIDPDLGRAVGDVGEPDEDLGYWPSYDAISPASRTAYLRWLAGGRRAPGVSIGYVFLFYYGLERRLILDIGADPSLRAEVHLLAAEVRGLLDAYGDHPSFRRYATAFLDVLELVTAPARTRADELTVPEPREPRAVPPPMVLRRALGAFAAEGRPLPPEWALAWAWHVPDLALPPEATESRDDFARVFERRYVAAHGDGIVLKPGGRRLRVTYEPASAGLRRAAVTRKDIVDAFYARTPRRQLADVVRGVDDEPVVEAAPTPGREAYQAAVAFLWLTTALSARDGGRLMEFACAALELDDAERGKLEDHACQLAITGQARHGVLEGLSARVRAMVGDLLIDAVTAGGMVLPHRVSGLLTSYRRLGLDPATVPNLLHRALTARPAIPAPASEPVAVRSSRAATGDFALPRRPPAEPPRPPAPPPLDRAAIQAKLAETATVSALLHDIFAEDDADEATPAATAPVDLVAGLDAPHSALLRSLAERTTWPQPDFDALASRHGLLPAGALDVLNEAALDATDDPVLVGDGDLALDPDVLQELLS